MKRNALGTALAAAASLSVLVATALPASSAESAGEGAGARPQQDGPDDKDKDKDKKASPSPSPTVTQPAGDETGCRDVVAGSGRWVRPVTPPSELGLPPVPVGTGIVDFEAELAAPSCPEVTYVFTLMSSDGSEIARVVKAGEDPETNLAGRPVVTVREVLEHAGTCIAIDVEVREGDVVHDLAPDVRDAHKDLCDTGKPGSPGQFWR